MKRLSILIPAYNAQDYLSSCLDRLPLRNELLEVIVINDGSSDQTESIANDYAKRFPRTLRAIHQVNKGHGGAINRGLSEATGLYVRVLDSDDWLDREALEALLVTIGDLQTDSELPELIITNYLYEKLQENGSFKTFPIRYTKELPQNELFGWEAFSRFKLWQHLMMHSLTYRLDLLRQLHFNLPEHSFYVDNLFAYTPLPSVKQIYYLNVDLYHYYIGRSGQSVSNEVLKRNLNQHLKVNRLILTAHDLEQVRVSQPELHRYLLHFAQMLTLTSLAMMLNYKDKDIQAQRQAFIQDLHQQFPTFTAELKQTTLGHFALSSRKWKEGVSRQLYRLIRRYLGYQ